MCQKYRGGFSTDSLNKSTCAADDLKNGGAAVSGVENELHTNVYVKHIAMGKLPQIDVELGFCKRSFSRHGR